MYDRYRVKDGENLSMIAKKFSTNINYLKSINDIYFLDNLRAGMDIIIPRVSEQYFDIIKNDKGVSLEKFAANNNINPLLLESMNGLEKDDYIYENQEVIIPKNNYSYYITKEGDTVESVASTFSVSQERILSQNETIYLLPGQIIANKRRNSN